MSLSNRCCGENSSFCVFISLPHQSPPLPAGTQERATLTRREEAKNGKIALTSADLSPVSVSSKHPVSRQRSLHLLIAHSLLNPLLPGSGCVPQLALRGPPKPGVAQAWTSPHQSLGHSILLTISSSPNSPSGFRGAALSSAFLLLSSCLCRPPNAGVFKEVCPRPPHSLHLSWGELI